jgi:benzodiazapine receptor
MKSVVQQGVALAVCIGICFAVAAAGSLMTSPRIDNWYAALAKPAWTPPDWVFGPVWTVLYLLMAVAAWQVWRTAPTRSARLPLTLFGIQLLLNLAWSGLFFGLKSPGWAFLEIIVLWWGILAALIAFWRRSAWAGVLMAPYLTWVSFAVALNLEIWRLGG